MDIKDIREKALSELKGSEPKYEFDEAAILECIKDAHAKICDLVSRIPHKKHFIDIYIGNVKSDYDEMKCKVAVYNKQIQIAGYNKEIVAELSSFSNIGDPYFMGKDEDRITYYVRIKEIL